MKLFNKEDQEYIKTYNAMADPELEDGLMEYLVTFNEVSIIFLASTMRMLYSIITSFSFYRLIFQRCGIKLMQR